MATPRSNPRTSRSSLPGTLSTRGTRAVGVLLATLLALVLVPFSGASADPTPTPAQARRELARLEAEVDNAVEDYNDARIALKKAQRSAAAVQARVDRAAARVAALRKQMGRFASAAYQSGGLDSFVTLMSTSNPQTFLDQATTLDQIARDQAGDLRELKAASHALAAQEAEAKAAIEATKAVERRMAAVRKTIEAKVARQQRLVEIAESAADAAAARHRAGSARASRSAAPRVYYNGPASGRAKIAVAEAYRQLGKWYQWGAAGPDRFDCSGLTMWVWGKAGVSLPHSSRMQIGYGRRVQRSELLPGDLVFYGSPIHHVGIYVGGGRYIAAPHTGAQVGFRDVNRGDWAGATRL